MTALATLMANGHEAFGLTATELEHVAVTPAGQSGAWVVVVVVTVTATVGDVVVAWSEVVVWVVVVVTVAPEDDDDLLCDHQMIPATKAPMISTVKTAAMIQPVLDLSLCC